MIKTLAFILALFSSFIPREALAFQAEEGVLELSQWDPQRDGPVSLSGQWHFYWQTFLSENPDSLELEPKALMKVPGVWNRENGVGKPYPAHGYASYRLVIKTGRPNTLWAIDSGSMYSSGRIFVNGQLLFESGKVGKTKSSSDFHLKSSFVSFMSESQDIDLRIEVANFDHSKGGLGRFRFATLASLQAEREVRTGLNLFVIGAIFLMILYHVALYALRPLLKAPLFFACSALTNTLFHLISGGWVSQIFPGMKGELYWDLFYTYWYIGIPTFSLFVHSLYPRHFNRTFLKFCIGIPALCIVWVWFTPFVLTEKSALVIQLFGFIQFFYLVWVAFKARRDPGSHSLVFITGATIYFTTIVHDILSAEGLIDSAMNSYFGLCAFVFFQSYMIAARFSQAFSDLVVKEAEITELNAGLERKVEEKTRDIRSILIAIKQGIFTLGRKPNEQTLTVNSEYSRHLETLLKTKDIVGRPPLELIFEHSDQNSEQTMMVSSVIEAALHEDLFAFEINSQNLPTEIRRSLPNGSRETWEVDWTPVLDKDCKIEKFLIALRDVSHVRKLEEEALRQQKELEYISEIVNISAESFQKFIKMSRQFLDENERLIMLNQKKNLEIIKILFINMHTIKGNARSYHFRKMSGVLHEIEQFYAELLNNKEAEWDQLRLRHDVNKARALIDRYEAINRDKLGRLGLETQVLIERSVVADKINSLSLVDLEAINDKDRRIIEDTQATFKSLFYSKAIDVFEEMMKETERLARDLKKSPPSVVIEDNDISLTVEAQELFRTVFTHIIRNSLDHGIETPEERLKAGKAPSGKIEISLREVNQELSITYHDDGRGLNLSRLAKLGIEQGYLKEGESKDPTEVANLIFYAGLSTSNGVSEISGRGVGMDAVRRFLQEADGQIIVWLDRPGDAQLDHRSFSFQIRVPQRFYASSNQARAS